jgi:hypothetical protein
MNQFYHQRKTRKYWRQDKGVKIAVGILAMLALSATFLPESCKWLDILAALIAAVMAIVLNVVPVGEWEAESSEHFRAWSDLRICTEQLKVEACELKPDETDKCLNTRYADLLSRRHELNAGESDPDEALLEKCRTDTEKMFGLSDQVQTGETVAAEARRGG